MKGGMPTTLMMTCHGAGNTNDTFADTAIQVSYLWKK